MTSFTSVILVLVLFMIIKQEKIKKQIEEKHELRVHGAHSPEPQKAEKSHSLGKASVFTLSEVLPCHPLKKGLQEV